MACWMSALTRLSFFAGPYISITAAMNEKKSPEVIAFEATARLPMIERDRHAHAAEQFHERRQARERGRDFHVGAEQVVAGAS